MGEADIKSRKAGVLVASPDATVGACLDRMVAANVGSILIADAKGLHGILTERDALRHWRDLDRADFRDGPVMAIATHPVFSLTVEHLGEAPREMVERHIRHVPLVESTGQVVGIVSMRDILAAQHKAKTLPKLTPDPGVKAAGPALSVPPAPSPGPTAAAVWKTGAHERVLHVVKPLDGIAELTGRLLPAGWIARTWPSLTAFASSGDVTNPTALANAAIMLDLDGLAGEDWRPLIRRLIQTLTHSDQPDVFLVASEERLAEKDLASLQSIAARARWRVYRRPLATAALEDDLKALEGKA